MSDKVQVIIPTILKDYNRMKHLVPKNVFAHLPAAELIFIGNSELCESVDHDKASLFSGLSVKTVNEDELVSRQPVIDCVKTRVEQIDPELIDRVRPGWYYQQFLKMAFSGVCEDEYYVSWDMDTVPLRPLSFFDADKKPCFDMKSEYNPGYFKTIENLLGIKKNVDGSFISEHMVFKKSYMKELMDVIEDSDIKGNTYWEKIISAIDDDYIALGFSEFETYGTYVTEKHADTYSPRRFASFRRGSWFVNESDLSDEDMAWLGCDYDAITFENAAQIPDMVSLFRNPKYRNNMSAKKFYETILESGYFGEYRDGKIHAGDWYAPV